MKINNEAKKEQKRQQVFTQQIEELVELTFNGANKRMSREDRKALTVEKRQKLNEMRETTISFHMKR